LTISKKLILKMPTMKRVTTTTSSMKMATQKTRRTNNCRQNRQNIKAWDLMQAHSQLKNWNSRRST